MFHRKVNKAFAIMLLLFVFVASLPVNTSASENYDGLTKSINHILNDSRLQGAQSSVVVKKASTGETVYQYNADKSITPASSLKLLTSAAAFSTLGENYRFSTEVLTDGIISKGVLKGNLYLRGKGDPTLLKKDMNAFAAQLSKLGIKKVTGHLAGDDTFFDDVRLSPSIMKNDESYSFAAQVSALTLSPDADYDAGSIIVDAKPTARGKAGKVTLTPATTYVNVVNRSKTVAKGNANTLRIYRHHGKNTIYITGNVPVGSYGKRDWISVSNPTAYTLHEFKQSLSKKGIAFSPASSVVRRTVPKDAFLLTSKQSMPLKDMMVPFMKLSNNTHAENFAKTMGREVYGQGSWDSGLQVMNEFIDANGMDSKKWKFEDASGMSHKNKVTGEQMSELLYAVRSEPWLKYYTRALPVAGTNERFVGGTLRNRMKTYPAKGNVIAKTGSLNNVNALAGFANAKNGETFIFTVLTEGQKKSAIPVIDRIASSIANISN